MKISSTEWVLNNFPTISHKALKNLHLFVFKLDLSRFLALFSESDCALFGFNANMWESVGIGAMTGFFFSGSTVAKLDEKGRFVLPQEMRYGLVEEGKCEFAIGLGVGGCLAIYKKSVMEKIVAKFQENQHVARFQKFFTLFFSTLHRTECDKVGRILLPQTLKSAVGIRKELMVAGVMDKIELWPKEVYEKNLQTLLQGTSSEWSLAHMTEEAFSLLSEKKGEKSVQEAVAAAVNPAYVP